MSAPRVPRSALEHAAFQMPGQHCLSLPALPRALRWLLLAERCTAPLLSQCCANLLAQFLISAAKGDSLLSPIALLQSDHR